MNRNLKRILCISIVSLLATGSSQGDDIAALPPAQPTTAPQKASEDTVRDFHIAVGTGDRRMVEKMINLYPDLVSTACPDDDVNKQIPPVFTAIDHGQAEVLTLLLKRGGTRINDRNQQTALYRATVFGNKPVVTALLDAGENIDGLTDPANQADLTNPVRGTPLRDAISNGHPEIAQLLLHRGAHIDIFSAAGLGWTGWVSRQAKEHPEEVDLVDGWRYTPLCYAVAAGASGTAEVLLSHGADVNRTYDDGGTLLHLATHYGNHDLIAVLLAHGADINAKNKAGETAVDFSVKYNQQDAEGLLKDHGGKRGTDVGN